MGHLPDKEFQRTELCPRNSMKKNKELNEIKKPIQDMEIKFNKEIDLLNKTQIGMMLEIKNSVNQVKLQCKASPRDCVGPVENKYQGWSTKNRNTQ